MRAACVVASLAQSEPRVDLGERKNVPPHDPPAEPAETQKTSDYAPSRQSPREGPIGVQSLQVQQAAPSGNRQSQQPKGPSPDFLRPRRPRDFEPHIVLLWPAIRTSL